MRFTDQPDPLSMEEVGMVMRYLFTKMRRDIAQLWVQFFSVFMMAVLAITIYSGMEGVWYGLKCEVEDYYRATNLADVWVNGRRHYRRYGDDISALDGVERWNSP